MSVEAEEHYCHAEYQRVGEMDCILDEGMHWQDRVDREADFGLKASGLSIGSDDRVLDLACGSGGHARRMYEKTGADIEAQDYSKPLVDLAIAAEVEEKVTDPTRKGIRFKVGNLLQMDESLDEGARFKLITVLGASFIFFHERAEYVRVLSELGNLLEDGGKIVVQLRTDSPECIRSLPSCRDRFSAEPGWVPREFSTITESMQEQVVDGEKIPVSTATDTVQGDSLFYVFPDPQLNDPWHREVRDQVTGRLLDIVDYSGRSVVVQRRSDGKVLSYRNSDGIEMMTLRRIYKNNDGSQVDFGAGTNDIFCRDGEGLKQFQSFFRAAGFSNVELKSEVLSPNGKTHQVAIVGSK